MSIRLADIVKYLKSERGVVANVSKLTGISQDNLYKWRDGRGQPSGDDMLDLVDFLKSRFGENPPNEYLVVDDTEENQVADATRSIKSNSDSQDHLLVPVLTRIAAALEELTTFVQQTGSKTVQEHVSGSDTALPKEMAAFLKGADTLKSKDTSDKAK